MTRAKKNDIKPITEKILLSEEYADKYDAYSSITDAFEYRIQNDGFTQENLATLLGVSKGVISRRLNGSANLTLKTLSNMATALRCKLIINLKPYEEIPENNYIPEYTDINSKFNTRPNKTKAKVQWINTYQDTIDSHNQWN